MKLTSKFSTTLATAAAVGVAIASFGATANAVTVRDHRGEPKAPQGQPNLICNSYKYCAKSGVIVRDHRTGATPGGK